MSSRSKSATINVVLSDSGSESIGEDHRVSSWPQRPWRFVAQLVLEITEHHTLLIASGVAFSAVLGLIPALVGVVSVYGLVASPEDVGSNLAPLTTALPEEAADLVVNQLRNLTAISGSQVTIGVVVGLFGVMWAISNALNAVVMAIRVAHETPSPHNWVQGRLFALKLSLVAVTATASSIWLVVALPVWLDRYRLTSDVERLIYVLRFPAVITTSALSIALLYRAVVGHRSGRYSFMSVGAIIGTAIWVASTIGLSSVYNYIGQLDSTFGSLGAVAALMVWFYLSAVAVLVGAEVDGLLHRGDYLDE
ncbi:MAG: membrane protein [Candidatus Poriferisodalaceae bacterium]|jgi:membrane protein